MESRPWFLEANKGQESENYRLPLMHEICPGLYDAKAHQNLMDIGDGAPQPNPKVNLRQDYAIPNCFLTPSLRQFNDKAYETPKLHLFNA